MPRYFFYLSELKYFDKGENVNYIVFDLEWNQAADLKTKLANSLIFEIIEIGAVKLNENMEITGSFSELIKPKVFKRMNEITGELIHINMKELENCRSFIEVAADFIKWCGEDYVFCTWGNLDLMELQRNMDYYNMKPISEKTMKFYDVQKLFSIAFEDSKTRRTLHHAVDFLKIKTDEEFHRAYSDAYYTAKIMQRIEDKEIFENYSFDTYRLPKNRDEEIKVNFKNYSKYISREFEDKFAAMGDKEVVSTRCYICGAKTRKKVPWFTNNGKHYYAIAYCAEHGMIKCKVRMRKSMNNKIFVEKTMKQVDDKTVNEIMARRNLVRELRKEKRHNNIK
jgi:inhibitor of KinA sporulation pathway (predicted exonuclease)